VALLCLQARDTKGCFCLRRKREKRADDDDNAFLSLPALFFFLSSLFFMGLLLFLSYFFFTLKFTSIISALAPTSVFFHQSYFFLLFLPLPGTYHLHPHSPAPSFLNSKKRLTQLTLRGNKASFDSHQFVSCPAGRKTAHLPSHSLRTQ
jgi:hypothetical protein